MAQKTDVQLQNDRATIENETTAGANTAARVGQMFEDSIDSKINNDKIVDEDDMASNSATLVPTQQSVKAYADTKQSALVSGTNIKTINGVSALGSGDIDLIDDAIVNGEAKAPSQNAVFDALALKQALANSATALVDASTMDLTAIKHTLSTSSATRTFTISYTGDDITIEVTLSATSSTFTFPSGSLCVSDGIATGDNTCPLAGVSGDKYLFAIKNVSGNYRVVCKNFGQ